MIQEPPAASQPAGNRVRVFIDFWNLQLTMNRRIAQLGEGSRFDFDWARLPAWLASVGAGICGRPSASYEGAHVYASWNPLSEGDRRLQRWMLDWLDRQPGVQVDLRERQRRDPPSCPVCHRTVEACPHCGNGLARTQEKGIDTAIVTDMIRLAWEHAYDIAVLVSSDGDFVPAIQFLDLRGLKTVQAGLPPAGSALAKACWASFDLFERRDEIRRP